MLDQEAQIKKDQIEKAQIKKDQIKKGQIGLKQYSNLELIGHYGKWTLIFLPYLFWPFLSLISVYVMTLFNDDQSEYNRWSRIFILNLYFFSLVIALRIIHLVFVRKYNILPSSPARFGLVTIFSIFQISIVILYVILNHLLIINGLIDIMTIILSQLTMGVTTLLICLLTFLIRFYILIYYPDERAEIPTFLGLNME